jgi:hypothetical protein
MPKIYGNLQKPSRSYVGFFRFFKLFLWLGVVGLGWYAVFASDFFAVKKVEVEGTKFVSSAAIAENIPLGTNIWLLPKDTAAASIMENNTVESVAILRGIPNSVKIVVREREPAALWISGATATVLDGDGFSYVQFKTEELPLPESETGQVLASLPRIQDTKGLPLEMGQKVVGKTFVDFIVGVNADLARLVPDLHFDHFEIADTTYDVTWVAKEGARVQFNTLSDHGVQARNLARMYDQKKMTQTSKVDLRIDRWGYVE